MNKYMVIGLFVFGLCGGAVSGSTTIANFPLMKELAAPEAGSRKIASFLLDEEMLAATEDNYSNLRVFDDKDRDTPFLVRCKRQTQPVMREYSVPMETIAFEALSDNRIEVVLKKEKREPDRLPGVIVFSTKHKNYEKQVTVYASHDRTSWELVAENRPIFDYSKHIDVRNNRADIKSGPYLYYKIEISNISESRQLPLTRIVREARGGDLLREVEETSLREEDFRIEKIDFLEKERSVARSEEVTRLYSVNDFVVKNNPKDQETIVTFDTFRALVTSLTILTGVPNFSRSLRIEGCDEDKDREEWRPLTSATISRINTGEFQQDRTRIKFGKPYRYKHYRITIMNRDSPPLDISGVQARGETHEALFFCDQSRKYHILYGAEGVASPSYDIAAVLRKVEGADTDIYSPGGQKANPFYSPAGRFGRLDGRRLLVPAVLLMVMALAWLIARSARSLDSSHPA